MNLVVQKNLGAIVDLVRAGAASTLTAGGAGNNVGVTGVTIDRYAYLAQPYGSLPMNAAIGIAFSATLSAGKALTVSATVNTSSDGVNWSPLQTFPAVTAASSSAGGVVTGVQEFMVSLTSAARWVQFVWTPALTATATDSASIFPQCALGGFDRYPAPN
jgi:hypothetical protein